MLFSFRHLSHDKWMLQLNKPQTNTEKSPQNSSSNQQDLNQMINILGMAQLITQRK